MKRLILAFLMMLLLTGPVFAQGRLTKSPEQVNSDRSMSANRLVRGPAANAGVPGKAMRLIASAATIEDLYAAADDINVDKKYSAFSNLLISVAADPSRTYLHACASAAGFWQQVPSASPLIISPVLLIKFESAVADGGTFYQAFDIPERRREFDVSTRQVNHTPMPSGCGVIDEVQLSLMYEQGGMSSGEALALSRQVIRSPLNVTVGFNVRMQSVPDFGLSDPTLQVWSD